MPAVVEAIALGRVHVGLEGAVHGPVGDNLIAVLPDARGKTSHVCRTEAGRELGIARSFDLDIQNIRLELEQEVVPRRATIGLYGLYRHVGTLTHGLQKVLDRVDYAFKCGPRKVGLLGAAIYADDQAAGVTVPVGR